MDLANVNVIVVNYSENNLKNIKNAAFSYCTWSLISKEWDNAGSHYFSSHIGQTGPVHDVNDWKACQLWAVFGVELALICTGRCDMILALALAWLHFRLIMQHGNPEW